MAASMSWRVERRATVLKFIGAAVFLVIPLVVTANKGAWLLGVIAAIGLVIYGVRDLLAPVRLSADDEGITVTSGYASSRRLPWSEIDRVRLDSRRRLGANSDFLEIDADTSLYFFSRYDLGVEPSEVLDQLEELRRGAL